MVPQWMSNTIFISRILDAGPIRQILLDLIDTIRSQDERLFQLRNTIDLEFLHATVCYSNKEFQIIFHLLSSESILDSLSSWLSSRYGQLTIKGVEIDARKDLVNFLVHEKGSLQSEKSIPKGLSRHLIGELERFPQTGRCFSFTIPEFFNMEEKDFIESLQQLKYNKPRSETGYPEEDLDFS